MKKVNYKKILGIVLLLFSLSLILYRLVESIIYNINGWYLAIPGPALYKWYEIFCFNLLMDNYYIVPSLIIGIILLIINHIKNDSGKKEIIKDKEEKQNKRLMFVMWTILIISLIFYFGIVILAINIIKEETTLGLVICISTIVFIIACLIALKFEVDAGYYECKKCHHKFVPTYGQALIAMHIHTTRYLKCPKCNKRSWARKTMKK